MVDTGSKKLRIRFTKKVESRRLTWFSRLLILSIFFSLVLAYLFNIHDFLSLNKPISAPILVVEGHVSDYVLKYVKGLDKHYSYEKIYTTGIPMSQGTFLCGFTNYADLTQASLIALGIDSNKTYSVPCDPIQRDRTFASAWALKDKLKVDYPNGGSLNIMTSGTHARRTIYLFKKALGPKWNVGVYASSNRTFNPNRWWLSSYGMRSVLYESMAWFYAVAFFYPDTNKYDNRH